MILNPKRIVLQPVTTSTSSSNGSTLNIPAGYNGAILHLHVSAASGTTPTLNVYVQDVLQPAAAADVILGPPSGTAVFDDFASFTQVTSTGDWVVRAAFGGVSAGNVLADGTLTAGTVRVGPVGLLWRVKWVITATTPSFTWSLTAQLIP